MKSKTNVIPLRNAQCTKSRWDIVKWVLVAFLCIGAFVLDHCYAEKISGWLRMMGWLFAIVLTGLLSACTQVGRKMIVFIRETQIELNKVTWPKRKEVTQVTMIVAIVVCILALILWGMDGILVMLLAGLTR